jgi:hypothetical protein
MSTETWNLIGTLANLVGAGIILYAARRNCTTHKGNLSITNKIDRVMPLMLELRDQLGDPDDPSTAGDARKEVRH